MPTSNPCYGDSSSGLIYKEDLIADSLLLLNHQNWRKKRCDAPYNSHTLTNVMAFKTFVEETMQRFSGPKDHENSLMYEYPQRNSQLSD